MEYGKQLNLERSLTTPKGIKGTEPDKSNCHSQPLFRYHVTDEKNFMHFEPHTPQYKKLKNGEFTSLNLRITDQNNNIITDGPQVTVVLHIKYNPF